MMAEGDKKMTTLLLLMTSLYAETLTPAATLKPVATLKPAATLKIDTSHSRLGFSIKHLVSTVHGEFKDLEGSFSFDPKAPEKASGTFTIKVANISTNNIKRDEHLRGADFFDAAKFPTIVYKVTKVTSSDKKNLSIEGDLTMHGITKPVTLQAEFLGQAKDPWGEESLGFEAKGVVNRKDFNIVFNKTLETGNLLLGEEVAISINLEAEIN